MISVKIKVKAEWKETAIQKKISQLNIAFAKVIPT